MGIDTAALILCAARSALLPTSLRRLHFWIEIVMCLAGIRNDSAAIWLCAESNHSKQNWNQRQKRYGFCLQMQGEDA